MSSSKSKSKPATSSVSKGDPSDTDKPSQFYFACRNNEIDVVKSSLAKLTIEEIDQIEPNGSTALHAAAYYGNSKVVKLLLAHGAKRKIKNRHGNTPYDEAKTDEIKKLFERGDGDNRAGSDNRFCNGKGASYEWIFVKGDPSNYASFNRDSLWKCETDQEFQRLCRGIRQHYVNENGPLADVENIEQVRSFIDRAIRENDPKLVVRAYTVESGFYTQINKDLAQMSTHWSGDKHERNIASIMLFHPVLQKFSFTGQTHRGMTMSAEDLNEYVVDSIFMNKTFLSTSKDRHKAELFVVSGKTSQEMRVICKYLIKYKGTGLKIETMSEYPPEKEVLILPYAAFKVKSIRKKGSVTEIDVEEQDLSKQTWKSLSHDHTLEKKQPISDEEDEDDYESMQWKSKKSVHVSQSHSSVKKMTIVSHGNVGGIHKKVFPDFEEIDPETDTHATIWTEEKGSKSSKSKMFQSNKQSNMNSDDDDNLKAFSASNKQSYATSKQFTSDKVFDKKKFMKHFEQDSDD